eukprot:9799233-Alexandrium_andersonii.AAC.1
MSRTPKRTYIAGSRRFFGVSENAVVFLYKHVCCGAPEGQRQRATTASGAQRLQHVQHARVLQQSRGGYPADARTRGKRYR